MSALKSGRADRAGGLGATVDTYKGELDWGGACRGRQASYWLVI